MANTSERGIPKGEVVKRGRASGPVFNEGGRQETPRENNIYLTPEQWHNISGLDNCPAGAIDIVLGSNGEAVAWVGDQKTVLHAGEPVDEYLWPLDKNGEAAKLWDAAHKLGAD